MKNSVMCFENAEKQENTVIHRDENRKEVGAMCDFISFIFS